jgi:hypothetical protein
MDFEIVSSDLNNKNIIAYINEKSNSFNQFGPQFIGKLVGRTVLKCDHFTRTVISLTILTHEYLTYTIPCEDILQIVAI